LRVVTIDSDHCRGLEGEAGEVGPHDFLSGWLDGRPSARREEGPVRRLSVLVALFMLALMVAPVTAAPKGDARDDNVGKKLWNFNVIAHPSGDWSADDDVCPNNGNRVFFEEGDTGMIRWHLYPGNNPDFDIVDCDGTYDRDADVNVNESLEFWVMIKLVGPNTSTLYNVCEDVVVSDNQDDLCLLEPQPVNLQRNATTKIFSNLADNEYEEVLWTFWGDWKIFQVQVYEYLR
jgi:hypothetical protein